MYNCWELFGVRHKGHNITFEDCYGQGKMMDMLEAKDVEKPAWCKQSYNWYNHGFYFRTGAHDIMVKNCRVRGVRCGLHADDAFQPGNRAAKKLEGVGKTRSIV